jgi:hypothetical protein
MSKTWRTLVGVVALVFGMVVGGAQGAVPGSTEDWSGGGVSGWTRLDALNGTALGLSNAGGALEALFGVQSVGKPEAHM